MITWHKKIVIYIPLHPQLVYHLELKVHAVGEVTHNNKMHKNILPRTNQA
jgi:hypothetical protein